MEQLWSDARMSLRIFRRSPALALSAVIALAMGIGFTTTMFSIVRGGTRALPVENPDQIVALTRTSTRGTDVDPVPFDYVASSRVQRSYTGLGAFDNIARLVIGQGSKLIAIGIAVGLAIAVGLSHALAAATEFFQPAGVLTYLAIAGALVATATVALLRPVRRALALAPIDALRRE